MREKLGFFICFLFLWGSCYGRFVVEKNSLHREDARYGRLSQSKSEGMQDCFLALKAGYAQEAGAAAILIADNWIEALPLITMDTPDEENASAEYLQNISIPSALISKTLGDSIKKAISSGEIVNINLDWHESTPHPDKHVQYEFWTSSNDECGPKCDSQMEFVRNFKGVAQILEQKGYTQFTPHYITWYCPQAFTFSKQCRSQCINHGRYCAPDPEQGFSRWYDGRDVVVENLRQICLFKVANESGKPWLWWDYVTDFSIRCPMKEKKYNKECADRVIKSLGLNLKKIDKCMGDPNADAENPVLKAEQDAQNDKDSRGDVIILPMLVINNRQYRGKLDKKVQSSKPSVQVSRRPQSSQYYSESSNAGQYRSAV
ncbi:hypothetical protein AAC387_Pa01g0828 [Persea americana]